MVLSKRSAALGLLTLLAWGAARADTTLGQMTITDAWARPTPPVIGVGAVYMTISNHGRTADRLLSVSTPAAGRAEIHVSVTNQGSQGMRALEFLDCPPGVALQIAPGGVHIMLLDLVKPLVAGSSFPITLHFRDAGTVTLEVRVG